jgi:Flp pilus assembly protein TadG
VILRRTRPATSTSTPGQALVEFAIVLPLLLTLVLGIIQFGFLFGTHLGLANATREGARYGATLPTTDGSTAGEVTNHVWNTTADTGALGQALGFSEGSLVNRSVTYCRYQTSNGIWHVRLTATVTYNHPLFIPIVGAILDPLDSPSTPSAFQVSLTEQMRVENPIYLTTPPTVPAC